MPKLQLTVSGNVATEPELRYTADGSGVVSFLMYNDRSKKNEDGSWEKLDGDPVNVSAWRDLGENVATSLKKGDRVVVVGDMHYRSWLNEQGEKRGNWQITADDIGVSMRWASCEPNRTERQGAQDDTQPVSRAAAKPASKPAAKPNKPAAVPYDEEPF